MTYTNTPINQWALRIAPREKLMQRGVSALTDAELVAILLGSGTREFVHLLTSRRKVLSETGGLGQLARSGVEELMQIKGIGPAKAISIVTAFELGRRKNIVPDRSFHITSAADAARYLKPR